MFGLELQTSGNVFVDGVEERQVAFRHDSETMTLEGDETFTPGASSELEFVTTPARGAAEAHRAVSFAADLARELAVRAKAAPNGVLRFRAGDRCAGGKWDRDCTLKIADPFFLANPQGTVGVGLGELSSFIERALEGLGEETQPYLKDIATLRELSGLEEVTPELYGFLTACYIFLLRATWGPPRSFAIGPDGLPLLPRDPNFYRIFTLPPDDYLKGPLLDGAPAFYKPETNDCRLTVNRDSPKSSFYFLHRTDFSSMFHALPEPDRRLLTDGVVGVPPAVWPREREWAVGYLFPTPYRADPVDPAAQLGRYVGQGWKVGAAPPPSPETWPLVEHGPTMAEWWSSVVDGRVVADATGAKVKIRKDLASPPAGIRGRDPAKLGRFPGRDENKNEYYSMGCFPMDPTGGTPLAVYEHRAFNRDRALLALGELPVDRWNDIVTVFHDRFVPPYT